MTAALDAFFDWLYRILDRLGLAAALWLCGTPDQPWSADA